MTPEVQKALAKAQISRMRRMSPGRRLNWLIELRQAALDEVEEWAHTVETLDELIERQKRMVDAAKFLSQVARSATGPH